jgi:hypothetical protein
METGGDEEGHQTINNERRKSKIQVRELTHCLTGSKEITEAKVCASNELIK